VSANPYVSYATAAVEKLTSTWFTPEDPLSWVGNDFWRTPTMIAELIDYAALVGGPASDHAGIVKTLSNALDVGHGYFGNCGYYDDETCWGMMSIAAREWFAPTDAKAAARYEQAAVTVFDDLADAWSSSESVCGGGVWWERNGSGGNFKAANSTLGYMLTAMGLYAATKTERYLTAAKASWQWIEDKRLIDDKGMVWGGLTGSCQVDPNNVPVIALQGNPLAPLWRLYEVTGDTSLLDAGQKIVDGTLATMVWPETQIFTTPVDGEWRGADEQWRLDHGNQMMFKGIFAGFLGDFAASLATVDDAARQDAARRYGAALRANADSLRAGYPQGIYDMDWQTGDPSYTGDSDRQTQAGLQYGAIAAFVAAAKAP
jgi:predicted alpha-1,6-mannanase (GH76 family)